MIQELEQVVLTADLPAQGLRMGDVGTVVFVYDEGVAYEVEFMTLEGDTIAITTVESGELRRVSHDDMVHARAIAG